MSKMMNMMNEEVIANVIVENEGEKMNKMDMITATITKAEGNGETNMNKMNRVEVIANEAAQGVAIVPRNYMKEFNEAEVTPQRIYDKLSSIRAKASETEEALSLKAKIRALNSELSSLEEEYKEAIEVKGGVGYIPTQYQTNLVYNKKEKYIFDLETGGRMSSLYEDGLEVDLPTLRGEVEVFKGYVPEVGGIFLQEYKYVIATDRSFIKLVPISERIVPIISGSSSSAPYYIPSKEFLELQYGVEVGDTFDDIKLSRLSYIIKRNPYSELILKVAPIELKLVMLEHFNSIIEGKKATIPNLLGIDKNTYNYFVELGYADALIPLREGLRSEAINLSKEEWIEVLEDSLEKERELSFYKMRIRYYETEKYALLKYLVNVYLEEFHDFSFKDIYGFVKFKNYVVEEAINQGYSSIYAFVTELEDYIRMCQQTHINPILFSSYLKITHDITQRNYNVVISEEQAKKFTEIYESSRLKEMKIGGYYVVLPKTPDDVKKEGSELNHCVGSYIHRILNGECLIAFLRKEKDKSLITFEIRGERVNQIRGKHNRNPKEEERNAIYAYMAKINALEGDQLELQ